jgi:hypothetical protein
LPPGIQRVFYVSPEGDNSNPGTFELPWKTFQYAAYVARAGDLVIFEDGIYYENRQTGIRSRNDGTPDAPVIFKSRNKHGANIHYLANSLSGSTGFGTQNYTKLSLIRGGSDLAGPKYITIQDFEFTQEERGDNSSDVMIGISDSQFISIIGNKVSKTFEDGIKASGNSSDILIEGNIISDITREGIDIVNISDSIIRNNVITNASRLGIMAKGGARNMQVYNNIVRYENLPRSTRTMYAYSGGGETGSAYAYDIAKDTGFEIYNSVFYNNVVYKPKLRPA